MSTSGWSIFWIGWTQRGRTHSERRGRGNRRGARGAQERSADANLMNDRSLAPTP